MIMKFFVLLVATGLLFTSGCGQGDTRRMLIEKAKAAQTQDELVQVLGQPAEVKKKSASEPDAGGGEMVWMTYKASDGDVTFFFHHGRKMSAMFDSEKK